MMTEELKILLVDDHEMVRQGFNLMLNAQDELKLSVYELTDGKDVLAFYKQEKPDLIFMDINMKKVGGIEATKKIIKHNKNAKIIALSMHNDDYHIQEMLNAGALGYLLKDTSSDEVYRAIQTVMEGKQFFSNEVAVKLMEAYKFNNAKLGKISKRELEVLKLIASELTNEEIAVKLEISKRTVDTHRQSLLAKTGVKNTVGLVKYALKNKVIGANV